MKNENSGAPLAISLQAEANTFWKSWATPTATTPDPPAPSLRGQQRAHHVDLAVVLPKSTTGGPSDSEYCLTALRDRVPIFSMTAGDGIGKPR